MSEVIGAVTVLGMTAAVARFVYFGRDVLHRIRDELRFNRQDVAELNRRFARVSVERWSS